MSPLTVVVLLSACLSLSRATPIPITHETDDTNESDMLMLVGDNMTISCDAPAYPPAMLFAQDLDRDHYHVVFFGKQQIDHHDVWSVEGDLEGQLTFTLHHVNIDNAANYVCNQPRKDEVNQRIDVVGRQPECEAEMDGETGVARTGHCILRRKTAKGDVALDLTLNVTDAAGQPIEIEEFIEKRTYIEAVFHVDGGFRCHVEGLDHAVGVQHCQNGLDEEEEEEVAVDVAVAVALAADEEVVAKVADIDEAANAEEGEGNEGQEEEEEEEVVEEEEEEETTEEEAAGEAAEEETEGEEEEEAAEETAEEKAAEEAEEEAEEKAEEKAGAKEEEAEAEAEAAVDPSR